MEFAESEVAGLDLESPKGLTRLIIEFFCSKPQLPESRPGQLELDDKLLAAFIDRARTEGLNYEQFRELLLVLRQNPVSRAFFKHFFKKDRILLDDLRDGVVRFRGFAMLYYGNFVYARRTLSRLTSEQQITECLFGAGRRTQKHLDDRPAPLLEIAPIDRTETWLNGEITGKIIEKETRLLNEYIRIDEKNEEVLESRRELVTQFVEMDAASVRIQDRARRNTDVYLTWDYLDVYVATSMRNKWEFEEVYDFIHEVFSPSNSILSSLKLRYFDPTQCKCSNSRDKGLLEGLMLKRASCTIYMAQEGDTLGKDSELAATLAQGKPVIAYVPQWDAKTYEAKIRAYPLEYFRNRLLILYAEGVLDDPACEKRLTEADPRYDETIREFMAALATHRETQPYTLAPRLDEDFKIKNVLFGRTCSLVAIAESFNFERRACLLRGRHPLSMQVDLSTGVANGVLVVRSTGDCARLLHGLLTDNLRFAIAKDTDHNDFTILEEEISKSPFRIVTHNERLANSFWNLFNEQRECPHSKRNS